MECASFVCFVRRKMLLHVERALFPAREHKLRGEEGGGRREHVFKHPYDGKAAMLKVRWVFQKKSGNNAQMECRTSTARRRDDQQSVCLCNHSSDAAHDDILALFGGRTGWGAIDDGGC